MLRLLDDGDIHDAVGRLRIYSNIMLLDYDNPGGRGARKRQDGILPEKNRKSISSPELFELQNGRAMDEEERRMIAGVFEQIKEGRMI